MGERDRGPRNRPSSRPVCRWHEGHWTCLVRLPAHARGRRRDQAGSPRLQSTPRSRVRSAPSRTRTHRPWSGHRRRAWYLHPCPRSAAVVMPLPCGTVACWPTALEGNFLEGPERPGRRQPSCNAVVRVVSPRGASAGARRAGMLIATSSVRRAGGTPARCSGTCCSSGGRRSQSAACHPGSPGSPGPGVRTFGT